MQDSHKGKNQLEDKDCLEDMPSTDEVPAAMLSSDESNISVSSRSSLIKYTAMIAFVLLGSGAAAFCFKDHIRSYFNSSAVKVQDLDMAGKLKNLKESKAVRFLDRMEEAHEKLEEMSFVEPNFTAPSSLSGRTLVLNHSMYFTIDDKGQVENHMGRKVKDFVYVPDGLKAKFGFSYTEYQEPSEEKRSENFLMTSEFDPNWKKGTKATDRPAQLFFTKKGKSAYYGYLSASFIKVAEDDKSATLLVWDKVPFTLTRLNREEDGGAELLEGGQIIAPKKLVNCRIEIPSRGLQFILGNKGQMLKCGNLESPDELARIHYGTTQGNQAEFRYEYTQMTPILRQRGYKFVNESQKDVDFDALYPNELPGQLVFTSQSGRVLKGYLKGVEITNGGAKPQLMDDVELIITFF